MPVSERREKHSAKLREEAKSEKLKGSRVASEKRKGELELAAKNALSDIIIERIEQKPKETDKIRSIKDIRDRREKRALGKK